MQWVHFEGPSHRPEEPSVGFLILSAERLQGAQLSSMEQDEYPLQAEVNRLYCATGKDTEKTSDPVVAWDRPVIVSIEAVARNPVDAVRTFYTSDLDSLLIGNFLLDKEI